MLDKPETRLSQGVAAILIGDDASVTSLHPEISANKGDDVNPDSESQSAAASSTVSSISDLELSSDLDSDLNFDLGSDSEEQLDESLASTIIEEIEEGCYICLICTCEIDRNSQIWSCQECYRVYDLECIKDWAVRGSSTTSQKTWRCPACNVENTQIPKTYTCWCGRVKSPRPDSLIPFLCGSICGSPFPDCVHSCSLVCHPGKHPQCGAMGAPMKCHCGKHIQQLPCLATPYATGWQCDEACDVTVCALGHKCGKAECHTGFCGSCTESVTGRCYCGRHTISVECSSIVPKASADGETTYIGISACEDITIQNYDCQVHFEELPCQPQTEAVPHCKYAPDVVRSCYCGKTPTAQLGRTKCTDPMPVCEKQCGKALPCGCVCLAQCHEGPCECYAIVSQECRCGHSSYLIPCKARQQGFTPICRHRCTASLSCKKHVHKEECCEFEQVGLRRERENRKKQRNLIKVNHEEQVLSMEAVHICVRVCNQLKPCGLHRCQALCHSGPCGVCLESTNEDLVCHCGKTVIPAPIRCGTKIQCQEPCVRERPCGHEQNPHRCHGDDVPCPVCTKLVLKPCNCGSKEMKNVLCSVQKISCGKVCNFKKECGHACNRVCSMDCTNGVHLSLESCQSSCRKLKNSCPHLCKEKCHFGKRTTCDNSPCDELVKISCSCGRRSQTLKCGASKDAVTNMSQIMDCDPECIKAKREEELRQAFNLTSLETQSIYSLSLRDLFRRQTAWCSKYDSIIRTFHSDYLDLVAAGSKPKPYMTFPPMTQPQRGFLHDLANAYKMYSGSQDKEPLRFVYVYITDATEVPEETLKQVVDREDEVERKRKFYLELEQSQIDESLFNAILVKDIFFGVSKEDLEKNIRVILEPFPEMADHKVTWIKESTFVFTCDYFSQMDKDKEDRLYMLLNSFKTKLREAYIAFECKMCMVDEAVSLILKTDNRNAQRAYDSLDSGPGHQNRFGVLGDEQNVSV